MESRMEAYLNAAISGNTENLPKPISRIDFLLCELIKTLGESGASIEEVEKIVTDKVAEIVADAPEDFNTLKELSDWIYTHEESAAAMNTAIQSKVDKEEGKSLIYDTEIARLANVENYDDSQMKEYVDSKIAFYDGIVSRSTNTDTTNCWVKIAECEAPNSTAQIMDEITLYPKATDSTVKTTCKVRVEGKGAYANTWKLHIIDSTKDFNSDKVKLIYDKNIVDDKRKIELWGYNINGWDGFYSQKTFGNNYTLTYGLKCLTSQNKFATTYLHDDFAEAPTIDISIKSLVNEGLTSLENDIALNRTTLGTQCKNLCNVTYTTRKTHTVNITVNSDKSLGLLTDSTTSIVCVEILTPLIRLYANVTYILTGTNNDDIRIELRDSSKSNILVYDSGSGVEYTPNKDIDVYVCLRIGKYISITSSVTVYPMLRIKGTDDTYEPYKESVDERLIQNKSDIAVNKSTLGYIKKNLMKNTATTTTVRGVTFTVNDDKSITVNGTASADGIYFAIGTAKVIANNRYILNGGPKGGSGSTYGLYTEDYGVVHNFGDDNIYIPNSTGEAIFRMFIRPNISISNVTFYPMLRYSDVTDDTYEPYIEDINTRLNALLARIEALENSSTT